MQYENHGDASRDGDQQRQRELDPERHLETGVSLEEPAGERAGGDAGAQGEPAVGQGPRTFVYEQGHAADAEQHAPDPGHALSEEHAGLTQGCAGMPGGQGSRDCRQQQDGVEGEEDEVLHRVIHAPDVDAYDWSIAAWPLRPAQAAPCPWCPPTGKGSWIRFSTRHADTIDIEWPKQQRPRKKVSK